MLALSFGNVLIFMGMNTFNSILFSHDFKLSVLTYSDKLTALER